MSKSKTPSPPVADGSLHCEVTSKPEHILAIGPSGVRKAIDLRSVVAIHESGPSSCFVLAAGGHDSRVEMAFDELLPLWKAARK